MTWRSIAPSLARSLLVLPLCAAGCLDLVYATGEYQVAKQRIKQSHADVIVRGRIVDETGKPLGSGSQFPVGMVVLVAVGRRSDVQFTLPTRDQVRPIIVCQPSFVEHTFEVRIENVRQATLVFLHERYEPAYLEIPVPQAPPGSDGKPRTTQIEDALVTMRSKGSGAASQPN